MASVMDERPTRQPRSIRSHAYVPLCENHGPHPVRMLVVSGQKFVAYFRCPKCGATGKSPMITFIPKR